MPDGHLCVLIDQSENCPNFHMFQDGESIKLPFKQNLLPTDSELQRWTHYLQRHIKQVSTAAFNLSLSFDLSSIPIATAFGEVCSTRIGTENQQEFIKSPTAEFY